MPRVNVAETEADVKVVAELPGLDEKDVTVTLPKRPEAEGARKRIPIATD